MFGRKSRDLWPDFAKELESASGVQIAFRQDGALIVPANSEETERLQRGSLGGGY